MKRKTARKLLDEVKEELDRHHTTRYYQVRGLYLMDGDDRVSIEILHAQEKDDGFHVKIFGTAKLDKTLFPTTGKPEVLKEWRALEARITTPYLRAACHLINLGLEADDAKLFKPNWSKRKVVLERRIITRDRDKIIEAAIDVMDSFQSATDNVHKVLRKALVGMLA